MMVAIAILLITGITSGIVAWKKHRNNQKTENQPQVYEALVNIVDQKVTDSVEDARSSLKKGDVIVYFLAGHPWSETEKNSYLILKIRLRPSEAVKLTEAKMKKAEAVLARQYRLEFPDFDLQKFREDHHQPFSDEIFSEEIIKKK